MAKIAAPAPFPQTSNLQFGGGGGSKVTTTTLKRKTPSELRGELLKRKNVNVGELVDKSAFPANANAKDGDGALLGNKKDLPKNPRYIDTRMDELFPARKSSINLRLLRKDIVKEKSLDELNGRLKNSSVAARDFSKDESAASVISSEDKTAKAAEKHSESTFSSVAELSLGGKNVPALSKLDMDKALKGLATHDHIADSELQPDYYERRRSSLDSIVSGKITPLDLTLKTTLRVISSTSVKWFHRSVNHGTFYSQSQCGSGAPCSWVYPQSPLPPPVIAAFTSAAVGGQPDFLSNRQQAWEDSFRSLYYMLRKEICDLFYVCTSQFVVMFVGSKKEKRTCNAYISRSTRGLRSLLKENDICFSMPLVHSKGDDIAAEDLAEFEKPSLHQADHLTMSDVDNSAQSLLMFSGNQNVHCLYDFLLNFRFIMTSLTGVDVPLLYSPVPFENAALSSPQVRCKEVRRADHVHLPLKDPNGDDEPTPGSSPAFCYSVEVKDTYLPPWVVSSMCSAMASEGNSFEASFVTDPTSIGLNVAMDTICPESVAEASKATIHPVPETQSSTANNRASKESTQPFGVQQTIFSPHLRSSFLKKLKYGNDGSYTASLSHV